MVQPGKIADALGTYILAFLRPARSINICAACIHARQIGIHVRQLIDQVTSTSVPPEQQAYSIART